MTPLGMEDVPGVPSLRTELRAGRIRSAAALLADNTKLTKERLTRSGSVWSGLREASELSRAEKQGALLFMPRQNTFWNSCSPEFEPSWDQKRYLGFFAVGATGMGLLNGASEEELRSGRAQYGFGSYPPARHLAETPADAVIMREARLLGFSRVIVIRTDKSGHHSLDSIGP